MVKKYSPIEKYITESDVVDFHHASVQEVAKEVAIGATNDLQIAKSCFEWVRDNIEHSIDANKSEVSCSASDVIRVGHGFCYAKSHLLAALLRANNIPAGFCYQRLSDDYSGFCLHGFNAINLQGYGWYRVDARGNKAGVEAQFCPPREQLAFTNNSNGEIDYGMIFSEPWPTVVRALQEASNAQALARQLPDQIVMG